MYRAASDHQYRVKQAKLLYVAYPWYWEPAMDDANHRTEVWYSIWGATDKQSGWETRLQRLRNLTETIGPEAFLTGAWPSPVPRGVP